MENKHRFPYEWSLKDVSFAKDKGKVFSCFACGGGSTMGYKLAGYDVIGCNEIDPRMNNVYVANHHPRYNFLEGIQTFKTREDLPEELYQLDVLDGSPPCSSFSTVGSREKGWGKEKKFREGQTKQVLDTLFFDFIDLAKRLQPKVVIAENVKGILMGEAKNYVKRIITDFDAAGYEVRHYLLNAKLMGVPQSRERAFFLAIRKDLKQYIRTEGLFDAPYCDMDFDETPILLRDVSDYQGRELSKGKKMRTLWENRQNGDKSFADINCRMYGKHAYFSDSILYPDEVCPTITGKEDKNVHYSVPRFLSEMEVKKISTFPTDYDFCGQSPHYICGMSVPPVMMAQVATRVYEQWLKNIPT